MSNMRDGPVLKAVAEVVKDHVGKAFAALRTKLDALDSRIHSLETDRTVKALGPSTSEIVDIRLNGVTERIDGIEQRFNDLPQPVPGPPGPPGPSGENGSDGQPGIRGDDGPAGKDGASGRDGTDGKDGIQGIAGKDGADGLSGKDGAPGTDGKDGKDGLNGKDGEPGPEGKKGLDGKDGLQGPAGIDGLVGKDGRDGIDGKDGAPGANGKDGANGINGKDGSNGLDGKNGVDGFNGKDAEPVDTAALTDAITQKVLSLIPPPIPGADGKDGASVDLDAVRILVAGEVNKAISALPKPEPGRDGRQGIDGTAGLHGKDAADIDPLDGIDESSAYPRGQWASHRGGLIYAYRTTDPIQGGSLKDAGWRVVVDGVADIVKSLSTDERTEITTHLMTSGKAYTTETEIPNIIYRGTYKEGEHQRGDAVTQAGSLWIANVRTSDKPGISKAWTLAVKRGSDGKDLNGTRQ